MKKRIFSLGLAIMLMLSAAAMTGCGKKDNGSDVADTKQEEQVYTPTFMYFVSGSDENYDEAMAVVEELKAEYAGQITFDIHNIDETPEDKTNFPVEGMTPALIMLNTSNDISAMEFMCADKDKLKDDIENALNGEN